MRNGQRYFYTVVAYDRGAPRNRHSPERDVKDHQLDPQTEEYTFDVNTASVIPRPKVAGYVPPLVDATGSVKQTAGNATGEIRIEIIDELAVEPDNRFEIDFLIKDGDLAYSVIDRKLTIDSLSFATGKGEALSQDQILASDFTLTGSGGQVFQEGVDYLLNAERGLVVPLAGGAIGEATEAVAAYNFYAVTESQRFDQEESNPVFDGLRILSRTCPLVSIPSRPAGSQISQDSRTSSGEQRPARAESHSPADYEIRFAGGTVDTSVSTRLPLPFRVFNLTRANQQIDVFTPDIDRDGVWDINETIIFLEEIDGAQIATWEVQFNDEDETGAFPGEGDVFFVRTDKPFTPDDRFEFTTVAATTTDELVRQELSDIYVVPNPYVATNEIEPRNR